jgi:hypothetical protein
MHARSKKFVATVAVVPVVATLAFSAAPSTAAANRQQTMTNGSFEQGRVGWHVSSARTKVALVKQGRGGSKALRMTNRRPGPAILNSRSNVARSPKAGQRYTVSAFIRTNQPGATGRMYLRETANGRAVKNSVKRFKAWKSWRKVVMTATTRRAGTQLNVRLVMNRLGKKKSLLVDDVSVLKWLPPTPAPVPAPPTFPTDPNPPAPGPTEPPGGASRELSNGCAINSRGVPGSCAAYLGSAYGSNTDPTPWEQSMGTQLGVRRTYFGASQVDKGVSVAKTDLANGRLPWISFKLPYGWSQMAAGQGDAWTKDLATKLSKLNGPVWLAFHHEPEGDGDITQWTAMQAHLAPIVRAAAPNVAYSIVLTGYNQFFGAKQYSLESLWPKNTKVDIAGFDIYNKYGVVKDGKENTKGTDMVGAYFTKLKAWSDKTGVPWGIAETGYTDKASEVDPQWVDRTYTELKQYGGIAFTYFNTNLNSVANWALTTDKKKAQFKAAIQGKPTL